MYVKNFNFLFKSIVLRKNGRIVKNCSSSPKKTPPPPLSPHLLVRIPKKGEAQKTKHSIVPRVFSHILVYISTFHTTMEMKDTHYGSGSCYKSF